MGISDEYQVDSIFSSSFTSVPVTIVDYAFVPLADVVRLLFLIVHLPRVETK